jgi:2-keto-3-deoxy-L-rhamnonate aldolase RhmA
MVESPAGVAHLPDLLAVEGVDGVLVGPHDFSVSHGIPEQTGHPVFEAALRQVIRTCWERHVGVGIHYVAGPVERERQFIDWGCNLIVHKSDTALVLEGIAGEVWGLRKAFGDGDRPQGFPWPFGPSQVGRGNGSW